MHSFYVDMTQRFVAGSMIVQQLVNDDTRGWWESVVSLHFNFHFPGDSGLTSFVGAKNNGNGDDSWSCKMMMSLLEL